MHILHPEFLQSVIPGVVFSMLVMNSALEIWRSKFGGCLYEVINCTFLKAFWILVFLEFSIKLFAVERIFLES